LTTSLIKCGQQSKRGTPFVVLEPSRGAVFRDELTSLMPYDQNA
jgi:hypothetical protein